MQQSISPYATIPKRILAHLIDIGLIIGPLMVLNVVALVFLRSLPMAILTIVLQALYKPIAEGRFGYTIGKKWMKIQVVDQATGSLMNLNQTLTRFLPWAIVYFTATFVCIRYYQAPAFAKAIDLETYFSFAAKHTLSNSFLVEMLKSATMFSAVWMFSDPFTRALHDRLARTVVVNDLTEIKKMKNP